MLPCCNDVVWYWVLMYYGIMVVLLCSGVLLYFYLSTMLHYSIAVVSQCCIVVLSYDWYGYIAGFA